MHIEHINPKARHALRAALHCVRNVMHLHVEEHLIAAIFQTRDKGRTCSIKQLHSYLNIAGNAVELLKQPFSIFCVRVV
ncbi:hypothetical protein D3C85_1621750 [compost metagenome]